MGCKNQAEFFTSFQQSQSHCPFGFIHPVEANQFEHDPKGMLNLPATISTIWVFVRQPLKQHVDHPFFLGPSQGTRRMRFFFPSYHTLRRFPSSQFWISQGRIGSLTPKTTGSNLLYPASPFRNSQGFPELVQRMVLSIFPTALSNDLNYYIDT